MSHMVIFRTPEGKPGYQPAETVQDAVEVVERLRNDEGVENVRIFRLEELTFEYRPYYKVELGGTDAAPSGGGGEVPSIFGGQSPESAPADDGQSEPVAAHESSSEESSSDHADDESPVEASTQQPPWAAPPPPPPPPGGMDLPSGDNHDDVDGDEFSGAGQRRGLFGR